MKLPSSETVRPAKNQRKAVERSGSSPDTTCHLASQARPGQLGVTLRVRLLLKIYGKFAPSPDVLPLRAGAQ
ncbi:hypothetical protein GCM10027456_66360 [Kineosporia babensis]